MEPIRLLADGAATGAANMARDLELLSEERPTVRLYGWRPACLSLGRAQTEEVVDVALARRLGVDIVQRPTGGGAILHNEEEVTYSVVLPRDFPGVTESVRESFRFVSAGVVAAFRSLGLAAELGEGAGGRDALCYLREEGVSITVRGRKISGGAQRRTDGALLQHGTVIVERDEERMGPLLRTDAAAVRRRVTSLREEGVHVPASTVRRALEEGFARALGRPLVAPGGSHNVPVAPHPEAL